MKQARNGVAGWKPARACETLRPDGGRCGTPASGSQGPARVSQDAREPNPRLLMRCRGGKPRRVQSGASRRCPPVCPGGARETTRGAVASDGWQPAVRKGIPGRRRNRLAGIALNQYQRYFPNPNLCKSA
jgi:hypothetical protein